MNFVFVDFIDHLALRAHVCSPRCLTYNSCISILELFLTLGAHAQRGSFCVSLSVCPFSLFCLLALLGVQREVSAATAREMQ